MCSEAAEGNRTRLEVESEQGEGGVGGRSGDGHSPELPGAGGENFVSKMRKLFV